MKPCVVCNNIIKKKESVMTSIYVCSEKCKQERKKTLPKKISVTSKDYWIDKGMSENEAIEKISFEQKKRSKRCVEYWINLGYSDEESIKKVSEFQSKNGKINLKKYTQEERQKRSPFSKLYWIEKGYTKEEAEHIIKSNSDVTSLNYYIKKYGEKEGSKLYKNMCNQRKHCYTLDGFIRKYGEKEGNLRWSKKFKNRYNSKKATKFFTELLSLLDDQYEVYTASNINGEYGVKNPITNKFYFYDFVIPELKLCIEFNGDYWHCNPNKYNPLYEHKQSGLLAKDIWENDKIKIETIKEQRGYDVIVIWESDDFAASLKFIMEKINELKKSKN